MKEEQYREEMQEIMLELKLKTIQVLKKLKEQTKENRFDFTKA